MAHILADPHAKGHEAVAIKSHATTIRTDQYRFTQHSSGEVELYDHHSSAKEQLNIAEQHPELIAGLRKKILNKMGEMLVVKKSGTLWPHLGLCALKNARTEEQYTYGK